MVTSGASHNVLSSGTFFKGDVTTEDDFRLDGKLEGNIECQGKVVIGPKAEVIGNIKCLNADIMGNIQGNVLIQETGSLKASVIFKGEIIAKYLEIEPGATFDGTCKVGFSDKEADKKSSYSDSYSNSYTDSESDYSDLYSDSDSD